MVMDWTAWLAYYDDPLIESLGESGGTSLGFFILLFIVAIAVDRIANGGDYKRRQ